MTALSYFKGSLTSYGLAIALATFAIDQAHKWAMLLLVKIVPGQVIEVTPFFDIVMVWNRGISYGLFAQESSAGQLILLAVALAICAVLLVWLARATDKPTAWALGLLIGGALGNAVDRLVHGAVADFFSFHALGYHWYVFNLADVAIVAGVAALIYVSFKYPATADD